MYHLIEKTNKDEIYSLPYEYNSFLIVKMHYHTHYKYWHVVVYFKYPPNYRTEILEAKEYIKTRKEAREVANIYMKINPDIFWDKLSDHYKDLIVNG